jgi:putative Holliday junction resolvase
MARIMAIDYGMKRVGLAVTDPLQIISTALDTIATEKVIDYLIKYCSVEEVEHIVIGEPTHIDGNPTYLTPIIHKFIAELNKLFPNIPVSTWDERFTSVEAKKVILAAGYKKKQRQDKALVDRVSATIILMEYMEKKH